MCQLFQLFIGDHQEIMHAHDQSQTQLSAVHIIIMYSTAVVIECMVVRLLYKNVSCIANN